MGVLPRGRMNVNVNVKRLSLEIADGAFRELSALAQGRDDAPDFPTQRPARRCIDYRPR